MSITDIKEKIDKILRQTDYTQDIAINKLKEHNGDEIMVIKSYLHGDNNIKDKQILSVQQEIYHQIRSHLNQPNKSAEYLLYKK